MSAIGLKPWLQHLLDHLPMARAGHDPEGVHQVRVAVRRLRVWLRLAGMRVLEDDLAWLVRAAGQVRDLEVLLQHPHLPRAFQTWGELRLKEARQAFVPLLESPRLAGLLQGLSVLPPLDPKEAESRLPRFVQQVERRAQAWRNEDSLEHLHALRRALRRLRYALEWLERDSDPVKALQEIFGQVGDLSFTLNYLSAFEAEGGRAPARYRKHLEAQLTEALEAAKQAWNHHQGRLRP
ncbi:MAG: CHAD domain-containing protein [Meiothermus sp.]|uniref:CHAD domain-containing protein n=1 Tax=Meiothermus sp. TaxID=1955249 RepID=UPI0025F4B8E8|nr:CHAD domain-containing protein [Meiothermus sp.]MCS7067247.1 CHAD domain-containing protein [Meiothermus sp.]MCX7601024.1 CHAD domain-containing protein [Meiothermus sp.]MDW8424993.1 CHAD domain-containing protein [Meiothermus sp.]